MAKRADEPSSRPPGSERLTPQVIEDYRAKLTRGEDIIHPDAWAGAMPAASGIAPRLRIGANRWFNVLWLAPIGFLLLLCAIAAAKGLRGYPSVEQFIQHHPGIGYATRFDGRCPAGCASSTS
jgi:hypothetical protein